MIHAVLLYYYFESFVEKIVNVGNQQNQDIVKQTLKLSMLGKNSVDCIFKYFSFCSQKEALTFHANCLGRRQFARNVKVYLLEKIVLICSLLILPQRMVIKLISKAEQT